MKTLFRTYTQQQAREKAHEYALKTDVTWDWYHTGDGWKLTAVWTKDTPLSETAARKLVGYLSGNYWNFADLARRSGMSLADVVSGAKTLVQTQRAVATANRNGLAAAVRLPDRRQGG